MMKTTDSSIPRFFKGAGLLPGFAIATAFALAVYILSGNFVIALSLSLPPGITLGIVLEERFQKKKLSCGQRVTNLLTGLVAIGIVTFIAIFIIVKKL